MRGWRAAEPPVVRLLLLFLLVGLLVFNVYTLLLLRSSRGRLPNEVARWMWILGETLEREVGSQGKLHDPGRLAALRERLGLDGLTWVEGPALPGLSAEDGARVLGGHKTLSPAYRDERGRWVRSLYLPVRAPGSTPAILRMTLEFSAYERPGSGEALSLVLQIIGLLGAVLVIAALLQRLRVKERELDRLRASAEERARTVEGYHEAIVKSVASGVLTFNTDRIVMTMNPSAERILGVAQGRVLGQSCRDAFGANSRLTQLLADAIEKQVVTHREEIEWAWPGGERSWIGLSSSLVRDQEGRVIGTTFVFTDLTEAKRLQEQVEVGQRLALLGEMSVGIAHEFRNYMGSLLGYARLLAKQLPEHDPRLGTTEAMATELHAMDRLIHDLLNLGRADQRLDRQPVDLRGLLHRVVGQCVDQTGGAKPPIVVAFEVADDLPPIQADEGLLRQALSNVVQNALEAMPTGGQLRVRASLRSHSTGRPQEVEVSIGDTGVGIPAALRSKIFLPFVTTKEKGTGIGLTLVQKIIHFHGGVVEVESRPGQTTFRLSFPLGPIGQSRRTATQPQEVRP